MRIPAWQCDDCHEWTVTEGDTPTACSTCAKTKLTQDPDTFDTWFSSGQWPAATLQSISQEDFEYYYPTSVMETGYDILPWWVCRMAFLGLYRTSNVPFKTVYLHGLVRDAKGQKMSKSKGNVINPLKMIDQYGADALRFSLVFGTASGNDQSLSEDKIRGMRNFANKLWNIGRFIEFTRTNNPSAQGGKTQESFADRKAEIEKEVHVLVKTVTRYMEHYRYSDAALTLYEYAWHRLADVHVEKTKQWVSEGHVEAIDSIESAYKTVLMLLHPFMPFVTEEIWKTFGEKTPLIVTRWPKP